MKVLVTGAAGFIGSHVVDGLLKQGHQVVAVDDLSSGEERFLDSRARFHRLDIRAAEFAALVRQEEPEVVHHLAAQMSVSRSVREPLFDADVNVLGGLNLLLAARDVNARIVFSSTGGAIYGTDARLPITETAAAWPVSMYGVSKLAFEHYLFAFRQQFGLESTILRYSNVYGPRQNPHGEAGVVAIFARRILAGQACTIHGTGADTRDYVHVADVARANLLALEKHPEGVFNIGTGRQTSTNTIFGLIGENLDPSARAEHGPPRPGDLPASALDWSRAEQVLGWRPEIGIEDGIAETAAWFRQDTPSEPGA